MNNTNSDLDPQKEMDRLAHVGSHEQDPAEFDKWQAQASAQDESDFRLSQLLAQPEDN